MSYIYSGIGVTRANGDAMGVDVMDIGIRDFTGYSSLGRVITTGIGKEIGAFKILVKNNSAAAINLAGTQTKDQFTGVVTPGTSGSYTTVNSEIQSGGVVEAILKVLAQKVTVLAYQVEGDNSGQISVIFEQTDAWSNANDSATTPTVPTNDYGFVVLGLQQAIAALGSSVGLNGTDVRGTLVYDAGLSSGNTFGRSIKFA
jgi:hypothetical protein